MKNVRIACLALLLSNGIAGCDGNLLVSTRVADSTRAVAGKVAAPTFSPNPGTTIAAGQTVTIVSATQGAAIYYSSTSDGSEAPDPTKASGTLYGGEISVDSGATGMKIKAIAIKDGMTDSDLASASYSISYPNTITVTLSEPSAQKLIFTGNPASVLKGQTMGIATNFSTSSYAWYLDDSTSPASTALNYSLDTSNLGYGKHSIALIAVDANGISYSGGFDFQVTH